MYIGYNCQLICYNRDLFNLFHRCLELPTNPLILISTAATSFLYPQGVVWFSDKLHMILR